MKTYDEAFNAAREGSPFSNGTEWELWAAAWCWAPCCHPIEKAWQEYELDQRPSEPWFQGGCPLILVAMMGRTPAEWIEQDTEYPDYICTEFVSSDAEPMPEPVPPDPNQLALFE